MEETARELSETIAAVRATGIEVDSIQVHAEGCQLSTGPCTCVPYVFSPRDERDAHEIVEAANRHHGEPA